MPGVELDAGLHNEGEHSVPGSLQPDSGELPVMCGKGGAGRLRGRGRQGIDRLVGAAGDRDLSADDIEQFALTESLGGRLLRHRSELRRSACDHSVAEGTAGVIGASHAAVQMNLLVARVRIGCDELCRLTHRLVAGQRAPCVRPQVITAEDDAIFGQAHLPRGRQHEVAELSRRHPGVSAELVDLVAGCLDERDRVVLHHLAKCSFEDEWVRGAHRSHAYWFARLVAT
jgi:hypothetical protein